MESIFLFHLFVQTQKGILSGDGYLFGILSNNGGIYSPPSSFILSHSSNDREFSPSFFISNHCDHIVRLPRFPTEGYFLCLPLDTKGVLSIGRWTFCISIESISFPSFRLEYYFPWTIEFYLVWIQQREQFLDIVWLLHLVNNRELLPHL